MDEGEQKAQQTKGEAWLAGRVSYIRGLKQPTREQQLLVLLAELPSRTPEQNRQLAALIRAERAAERLLRARAAAVRVVDAEKRAARKARDHELYKSAGLLIEAGLVDSKTGKPIWAPEKLLAALKGVAGSAGAKIEQQPPQPTIVHPDTDDL
jgi:CTP:molybdopterin cytidylyltransferase MocA